MKKNKLDKELRQKLRKNYRLEFVDETRMQRLFHVRGNAWNIVGYVLGTCLVVGLIVAFIIALTPAKVILPGYADAVRSTMVLEASQRLDSIARETAAREQYARNLLAILNDDIVNEPQEIPDSLPEFIPIDSIITASEIEREFLRQYEHDQRINAAILSPIAAQGIMFVNPLPRAEAREPENGEDPRRVTFDMLANQPVSTVYRGTVLDVYNTLDHGFSVIVLHPNEFISRYSGLTEVFVSRGEELKPGQNIGQIDRDRAERFGAKPSFELWYKNSAINPRDYIPF